MFARELCLIAHQDNFEFAFIQKLLCRQLLVCKAYLIFFKRTATPHFGGCLFVRIRKFNISTSLVNFKSSEPTPKWGFPFPFPNKRVA